jgi:hypothetical protein
MENELKKLSQDVKELTVGLKNLDSLNEKTCATYQHTIRVLQNENERLTKELMKVSDRLEHEIACNTWPQKPTLRKCCECKGKDAMWGHPWCHQCEAQCRMGCPMDEDGRIGIIESNAAVADLYEALFKERDDLITQLRFLNTISTPYRHIAQGREDDIAECQVLGCHADNVKEGKCQKCGTLWK